MLSSPCKSMESFIVGKGKVCPFDIWKFIVAVSLIVSIPAVNNIFSIMKTKAWSRSYSSQRSVQRIWTYDSLRDEILDCKSNTINFLMEKGVLKSRQDCPKCGSVMSISKCSEKDAAEEVQFRCQKSHFDSKSKGMLDLS